MESFFLVRTQWHELIQQSILSVLHEAYPRQTPFDFDLQVGRDRH